MKSILSRLLVLSLCLLLPLLAVGCVPSAPSQVSLKQGNVQPKGAPGFIAVSESSMTWADAKAFCQRQGGRLPRMNNSNSWDGRGEATIDGFGAQGAPWPSALPNTYYWTGTERTDDPASSWLVNAHDGKVGINISDQFSGHRVVCVR